jgi:rRNA maturation protein Nop10
MPKETPLFENAVDSLQHGIAHYLVRSEHPTAIKHAVLTIYHAIELFLKERLAQVHPLLIYRTIDRPITDDSVTVGLEEALGRLSNVGCGLEPAQAKTVRELQRRRNRIEHHRFDPLEDHQLVVGQAIKFLLDFLPKHLATDLSDFVDEDDTYRELLQAALSYDERRDHALAEARAQGKSVITCPECGEDTLCLDPSLWNYCYFCRTDVNVEECGRCGIYVLADQLGASGLCDTCESILFGKT